MNIVPQEVPINSMRICSLTTLAAKLASNFGFAIFTKITHLFLDEFCGLFMWTLPLSISDGGALDAPVAEPDLAYFLLRI